MAFSGLHVTAGYAGSRGNRSSTLSLIGEVVWSHTFTTAGTTTEVAPPAREGEGDPMFQVIASADSYVAIGPTPNASASPRILVPANAVREFYAEAGDKLAWVAA